MRTSWVSQMSESVPLLQNFGPHNSHHLEQAKAWLDLSEMGKHTTALSYAALELRFSIERLALEYWRALLNRPLTEDDRHTASSFKRIEKAIYRLAGYQRAIDLQFEFAAMLVAELKIEAQVVPPQMGRLSNYWHECSELCHVAWPIASRTPDIPRMVFEGLIGILDEVTPLNSSIRWITFHEEAIDRLRHDFVEGKATLDDARAHLRRTGIFAVLEYPDGRPSQLVGEAVPPNSPSPSPPDGS